MPRLRSFAAAMVLMLPLAADPAAAARTDDNRTWNRTFEVARHPTVRIKTDDARVTVRSWKEPRVSVRVEQRGKTGGLVIGRRRPVVEMSQQGNEVRVLARMQGSEGGILVISTARLEVEVWLPRESDLIVDSGDGAVSVEDVAGHIELETQDGALTARGLKGDITVRSSDGRVELDDVDGALTLETRDGHARVRGRFDRMDVESADGGIEVDVLAGSRLQEGWSLRSQDGGLWVRIPRNLAATLDARTEDGGLSVDLPIQVQGTVRHHELVGKLNGGGPILRLRCSDGTIRLGTID